MMTDSQGDVLLQSLAALTQALDGAALEIRAGFRNVEGCLDTLVDGCLDTLAEGQPTSPCVPHDWLGKRVGLWTTDPQQGQAIMCRLESDYGTGVVVVLETPKGNIRGVVPLEHTDRRFYPISSVLCFFEVAQE